MKRGKILEIVSPLAYSFIHRKEYEQMYNEISHYDERARKSFERNGLPRNALFKPLLKFDILTLIIATLSAAATGSLLYYLIPFAFHEYGEHDIYNQMKWSILASKSVLNWYKSNDPTINIPRNSL